MVELVGREFLKRSFAEFRGRESHVERQLDRADETLENGGLSEDDKSKLVFYQLLARTYLMEMDFLADGFEGGVGVSGILHIASVFRTVGRDNLKDFPKMIRDLKNESMIRPKQ